MADTVRFLVHEMLSIYGIRFTDENSRNLAIESWAKQFEAARPEVAALEKSREIFREAFAHISMHIHIDDEYQCHMSMPRNEWEGHASVQEAIAEEHRLCGTQPQSRSE